MKKTTQPLKYFLTLILFTSLFFFLMSFLYTKYQHLSTYATSNSLDGRLSFVEMRAPFDHFTAVATNLYLDGDYEPAFDAYWDFAKMESYYLQGITLKRALAAGDSSKKDALATCQQFLTDYLLKATDPVLKSRGEKYLHELQTY